MITIFLPTRFSPQNRATSHRQCAGYIERFLKSLRAKHFEVNMSSLWSEVQLLITNRSHNVYVIVGYRQMQCWMCLGSTYVRVRHLVIHWGRVTHICVVNLTIIGSNNGLSPGRRQAIIWTNAGILLIGPLGNNFNRNSNIFIQEIPIWKCRLENAAVLFVNSREKQICCDGGVSLQFRWISHLQTDNTAMVYEYRRASIKSNLPT